MASEIREKPIPTPHPDQPRTSASAGDRGRKGGEEPEKIEEFDPDEMSYDSCVDDSNLHLTEPVSDPDPVLKSDDPAEAGRKRDQPRTAEIFDAVRPGSGELTTRRSGWLTRLFSRLKGGAAGRRSTGPRGSSDAIPAPHRPGEIRRVDSGSDDDENGTDVRGIWLPMLLLSYSSAVTLGLAWVLWTGRTIHPATRPSAAEPPAGSRSASRKTSRADRASGAPADSGGKRRLHRTDRTNRGRRNHPAFGFAGRRSSWSARSSPCDYRRRRTELARPEIQANQPVQGTTVQAAGAKSDPGCCLRCSTGHSSRLPDGGKIAFYPLAVESEWLIAGPGIPGSETRRKRGNPGRERAREPRTA